MNISNSATAPKRIFVLEDDPVNRLLIENEFESEAYDLLATGDSVAALGALQKDSGGYHIGIFDLKVPSHAGDVPDVDEALKVISAARAANPSMIIVTISSIFVNDDVRERLNQLHVGKVFSKPFSLAELHRFIDSSSQ